MPKSYNLNPKITFSILSILITLLVGCYQNDSAEKVLEEAKEKLSAASSVNYKYNSNTHNKFNDTRYTDTAKIAYYKIENSLHGFGFHAKSKNEEYLFDGFNFEKLKHLDKLRVVFEKDKIEQDSNYFHNFTFLSSNPIRIKEHKKFALINDTTIKGRSYFAYKDEIQNESKVDAKEIVKYQKYFYVNKKSKNIDFIQDLIIKNTDTLQIIDHYFTAYKFNKEVSEFPKFEQLKAIYKTIPEEDEYEEFTYTPIEEGTTLTKKTYKDINQHEISIYGNPQKSSLILFSFIGCTPCEIALKDLKEAEGSFTDKINIYYSSFQNGNSAVKKYLKKKELAYQAFGKESNMIEAFSMYQSPSFVLIDSKGKVKKVIEGYDEDVKEVLFDLLKE